MMEIEKENARMESQTEAGPSHEVFEALNQVEKHENQVEEGPKLLEMKSQSLSQEGLHPKIKKPICKWAKKARK